MIPLACDVTAIPLTERGEHDRLTRRLVGSATEIRETGNGFAFRLSADDYDAAVQFVARERLCCPFLEFVVEVTSAHGPVWLLMRGPLGTPEFLRVELHLPATG
jgi:hypothetical protein